MSEAPIGFRPRPRPEAAAPEPVPGSEPSQSHRPRLRLVVEGMTCGHCAETVSNALQRVPGVASARVSQESGTAEVVGHLGRTLDPAPLLAAVIAAGYRGRLETPKDSAATRTANPWQYPLWLGVTVTGLLWLGDWILPWAGRPWYPWLAFGLALPVQVWLGGGFFRGAWRQLRVGRANMDTLVTLGSAAAFGYSLWELFFGARHHFFFTEAVTILTFISLGHWLEVRLKSRAGDAVRELLELTPSQARRILSTPPGVAGGRTEWVPVAALRMGDLIELAPGDSVPVDATVVQGQSAVTEAMLTGEAQPVEKSEGDPLYAGTLNQTGRLRARVTATGDTTALAGIVAAVQRAQSSRAAIQRLADQVSNIFVPVVVLIALGAATWWWVAPESARGFQQFLSLWTWSAHVPANPVAAGFYILCAVLIVACPCALGLATPMALLAGVNVAARRGILIRDALALEAAGSIDTVAFDKTGTLTLGTPVVVDFHAARPRNAGDASREFLQKLAASVSHPSRHPLSRAIAGLTPERMPVTDWREERAAGVGGLVSTAEGVVWVQLGSAAWLIADAMTTSEAWSELAVGMPPEVSLIGLTVEGRMEGLFALADPLRPDTAALLARLVHRLAQSRPPGRSETASLQVLSGDRQSAVDAVVERLQRELPSLKTHLQARGQLLPEAKSAILQSLQTAGHRVAFVGDGLNDAPALAQADLGLAVAGASDVAREAADIILLRPDLAAVVDALEIAQATRRTIRQNLVWALIYNLAAVPLAAVGLLHPVICALTMGLSDLLVVGNALRLKRWRGSSG